MKKVYQSVTDLGEGDCMRACIALDRNDPVTPVKMLFISDEPQGKILC